MDYLKSAFIFTFVRNPWDRIVSQYHYYRKLEIKHPKKIQVKPKPTFAEHVEGIYTGELTIPEIDWRNVNGLSQSNNQVKWLNSVESLGLNFDFIGRFENFEAEVFALLNKLDLENREIPKTNTSNHSHYTNYYTPRLVEMVGEIYKEDCKRFGYQFPQ
jgi:hypothetical protein